jgi:hypothetical protein
LVKFGGLSLLSRLLVCDPRHYIALRSKENNMSKQIFRRSVLAFTALCSVAVPSLAQQPLIQRIQSFHVSAGRASEFEANVKQYNEILKTIPGAKSRFMYRSMTGPGRYILAMQFASIAELDENPTTKAMAANPDLARAVLRINACIDRADVFITDVLPELSIMSTGEESPVMLRVGHTRITAAKRKEYEAMVKSELVPAYAKAGWKSYQTMRIRFGAPASEYFDVIRVKSWADVENTLTKAMGQAAYDAMAAKLIPLTEFRELNLFRFRPELTFVAGPAK